MTDVLKNGSRGEPVTALQNDLIALGYELTADGTFGNGTEKAIRHLQKSFGYNVDGEAGEATRFLITQQKGLNWRANLGGESGATAGAAASGKK